MVADGNAHEALPDGTKLQIRTTAPTPEHSQRCDAR